MPKNGSKFQILEECVKYSRLCKNFKQHKLSINMRTIDNEYREFLLLIDDGKMNELSIPNEWITNDICDKLYNNNIMTDENLYKKLFCVPTMKMYTV